MRSIRKRTQLAASVAVLALGLAACGDDTATDAETAEDTGGETTESTESTEGSGPSIEPVGPACDQIPSDGDGSSAGMADDPVGTAASNNPLLSTLVDAVTEADLVDTLNSADSLTVFAPINAAFEEIPEEDMNAVMSDQEMLTTILTTHVHQGDSFTLEELGSESPLGTIAGGELEVDAEAMTVTSPDGTEANIVCGNVETANATVFLVDTVLMPAS